MRIRHPLRGLYRALILRTPFEAQLIVTRRCNLSCGYCSEFDAVSPPIPLETLKERIDALHRLRVISIAFLGGEPLLHPDIGELVAYAGRHAEISITTNGFLISEALIERLNQAGLSNLQVSIDRLTPDATGYVQKSLKSVLPKLRRLRERAQFDVHVTMVLCEQSKSEARTMLRELEHIGVPVSLNLMHDAQGMVAVGGADYLHLWDEHHSSGNSFVSVEHDYGRMLLQGQRPEWQCRAGARFLYVDESGNVQFCSAQRGRLGKPVTEYTTGDLRAHARTRKGCEAGCGLFCGYRNSLFDNAPGALVAELYPTLLKDVFARGLLGMAGHPRPAKSANPRPAG